MRFAAAIAVAASVAMVSFLAPARAEAQHPVAWGAFTPGAPESRSTMEAFNDRVGRRAVIWHTYKNFDGDPFPYITVGTATEAGAVPLITWEPWNRNLRAIARGDEDGYLRGAARSAKGFGKPILLRFAHEMNGDWYPWGLGVNGNSAGDYVAAWRHVVNVFRHEGADNVRFVWAPNVGSFDSLYPGDEWVDFLGLDGYNWGLKYNNWESFDEVFDSSYRAIVRLSHKPIIITEFASDELGGDKAAWVRHAFSPGVMDKYPQIRALVWFDENKETDWRVNSSAATLSAFQGALNQSLFGLDANGLLSLADAGGPPPADPPAATPPPAPADHASAAGARMRCAVRPRRVMRMRMWTIDVPIHCSRSSSDGCFGWVKVKQAGSGRRLGLAEVELWPGRRKAVRIGLPGWGRPSLAHHSRLAARVAMRTDGRCSAARARHVRLLR